MRKKSQKFFLGLISMILVVSMVAGCSGKSTSTPDNSEKPNGKKQEENTSEGKVDVIFVWTNNAARKDADFEMVEEFNNTIGKEKGIKIDYKVYGGDYGNTIRLAMAAGEAPHLFKLPGNVSEMVAAAKVKHILPISDLPGGEEWLKKYDGMLDPVANMYDGKVYSVPHSTSAIAVAYNKELLAKNGFNEPPKTWSELREMAKVVTENGNGKEFGFIDGLKSGSIANWNGLYHYVASVGHTGWDHKKGEYAYKDFAPFFDMLAKMRFEDKSWFPGAEGLDNDAARARFAEGVVAFKPSASWDVGVWSTQFPTKMEWGFCKIVEDPENSYKEYISQAPVLFVGAKGAEASEKTLEVLKAFNSDKAIGDLYAGSHAIPYTDKITQAVTEKPSVKNWEEVADISNALAYPAVPTGQIKIEGEDLRGVVLQILSGVVSAEKGFTELDEKMNASLKKMVEQGFDIEPYIHPDLDTSVK